MSEHDNDAASARDDGAAGARSDSEEPRESERPLADRRPADQGARPSPDEELAGEDEPSPTDPASYDPDQARRNEPPDHPTRA
ncbi:hypothetical protein ACFQZU_10240 [Streptomonospora algeriensis]|uniref:Uncharacterized protein n=1 Tax=Streptomonospora algeriensis TaxID=995084 RepID=A0ABW3BEH0_9ACTN